MKGKHITLAVTGAIAAYKAVQLLRLLRKAGAEVQIIGTENSLRFVGRETWEALSGRPPLFGLWEPNDPAKIAHIMLAQEVDLIVVAPATANIIAKAAGGIADDLVSTVLLAATVPILFAPCMNTAMYDNPATRRNIALLAERRSVGFIDCGTGELACGTEGKGRMAEPADIFRRIEYLLSPKRPEPLRWLIAAGATREYIDPIRFITNGSVGTTGRAIADAAWRQGGCVTLVAGNLSAPLPTDYSVRPVVSAAQMHAAVTELAPQCDILVMSAAVADYAPVKNPSKLKKGERTKNLALESTADILTATLPLMSARTFRVGFAAETDDLIGNARGKRERKQLDMVIANLVSDAHDPFGNPENRVVIVTAERTEELPLMAKGTLGEMLAARIYDAAIHKRNG
ncbi:MAG TPA: bifunctional phosphopantothenoylcysteine decarboxylase/phosphopantothenate--cysteine ligase CoaBC [bacterium]|nr:bifunctional phosphopantothenoylcysteine decarboxylase/phosphopantothenate--cysteine ligase CoaBC [bacterium]